MLRSDARRDSHENEKSTCYDSWTIYEAAGARTRSAFPARAISLGKSNVEAEHPAFGAYVSMLDGGIRSPWSAASRRS